MSVTDEIEKLKTLRDQGTLSEEEFTAAKSRVLTGSAPSSKEEKTGTHRALWALVIVVFLVGGAMVALMHEASQTLKLVAGAAAVGAGAVGGILAAMEDLGFVAIGGLGLGAIAIGAIAFAGMAPILVVPVLVLVAIGALWSWFGEFFTD